MTDKPVKGAGGKPGGIPQFLLGTAMTIGGLYLLLNALQVVSWFGGRLFGIGGLGVTSGMIMIPFIIGIVIIFYDAEKWYGWLLAIGSILALIIGAIASVEFRFQRMTAFEFIVILVLLFGGIGLVFRSVRNIA
ncbi:MAG: hypothetical protein OEX04_15595 [Acidimicrobiia bacterium]|nr:hypothetical protein [Acidimicrobiia bacterium]MDH5292318.1 hypothetical protein [Acidimicrobiia bacterium]